MKGKGVSIILTVFLVVLVWGYASADEVWLKNGDRLTGKVVSLEGGTLLLNTSYAGDLSIKWAEVVNLKTDSPIKVVLGDETAAQGLVTPGDPGKVKVKAEQVTEPVTVDLANVKTINPKPPSRQREVNVGASFTSGNTDTGHYADGEFIARTDQNRYTIGGLYKVQRITIAKRMTRS
jgi:hypothetical protein